MFTGIIEEIGTVKKISHGSNSCVLQLEAKKVLEGTSLGDSIAVNGVCLTVTRLLNDGFEADVMAETVRRTGLSYLKNGKRVNLERALKAGGRFGGHMVLGHIDGTGEVTKIEKEDNAFLVWICASNEILKYIVEKGSITIDGISLTVAGLTENGFFVSIIPHTGQETTLLERKIGDMVNLETDIIGKYVERLLSFKEAEVIPKKRGLTADFLLDNGFL